ncbi:MAG: hypothetical protein AAGB24_10715 [Bacteroidota bacterium]
MKKGTVISFIFFTTLLLMNFGCSDNPNKNRKGDFTWTYTYIKSIDGRKNDLKQIILQNWFEMDRVAQEQGLIRDYMLLENISDTDSTDWDFIVAVEYFTKGTYAAIAEAFEKIRKSHKTVKVNGMSFSEVGKVVRSEVVKMTK